MTEALIVGAGITGLATATVLSRQGIKVDLVERQPEVSALGSGITLIGAALRALDEIGLYEECVANGYSVTAMENYAVDGTMVHSHPLPSPLGTGHPGMIGMMRPVLHRILLDHAAKEGIEARTDTSPTQIDQQGDGATVTFSTGERRDYDLVVGADGLKSTVRDLVLGPISPDFRGQGIFRVILPRPTELTAHAQFVPAGDVAIGLQPLSTELVYMYILFPVDEAFRANEAEIVDLTRQKLEPFGGIAAKLREEVRDPSKINYTSFETIVAPDPWYRGRAVVIGDAAHAATPHLAAGGAMCLEDAVALGQELAAAPTIDDALRSFSKRRYDRCKFVVETAAQLSFWQIHPGTPGADHVTLIGQGLGRLAEPF
jgi:2-polyprenyl-6-methoxyphenol hydroxylase-like FAD-dependent oxidoreductase